MAARAGEAHGQLPQGGLALLRPAQNHVRAAADDHIFRQLRQGLVERQPREIMADAAREQGHREFGMQQILQFLQFRLRFLVGRRHIDREARQDLEAVGIAPALDHAALHVRIEDAGGLHHIMGGEDHFRRIGGELAAIVGGAGLHDHRLALGRAGHIERAAHVIKIAVMIEHMHLRAVGEDALRLVAHKGVPIPGIPEGAHHLDEFAGALVALHLGQMGRLAEIQGLGLIA